MENYSQKTQTIHMEVYIFSMAYVYRLKNSNGSHPTAWCKGEWGFQDLS
jgi:hypothetical protein